MFLKLTDCVHNEPVFLNSNEIRKFSKYNKANEQTIANTCIELQYGTMLVKERPEEIMEMLKGSN